MNVLGILSSNKSEPADYIPRPTVKLVILDEENRVLTFADFLVGGGVDKGETLDEAIARECMEEAGAVVTVERELGTVIQYRDFSKRKYIVHGFIARLVSMGTPTTTQRKEINRPLVWKTLGEAISFIEESLRDLETADASRLNPERFQARLYNAKTHLEFLKLARGIVGE